MYSPSLLQQFWVFVFVFLRLLRSFRVVFLHSTRTNFHCTAAKTTSYNYQSIATALVVWYFMKYSESTSLSWLPPVILWDGIMSVIQCLYTISFQLVSIPVCDHVTYLLHSIPVDPASAQILDFVKRYVFRSAGTATVWGYCSYYNNIFLKAALTFPHSPLL